MKFTLPAELGKDVVTLERLRHQADLEIEVFRARRDAAETFSVDDIARLEYLVDSRDKIDVVTSARLARHEAGHAVMAVLVGDQVANAEVFPIGALDDDGRQGVCQCVGMNVAVEQQHHLIAAAGCCAEAVWEHGSGATVAQVDARLATQTDGDGKFLRNWALTSGAGVSVSPTREALPLVQRFWPAIEALAAQIGEHGAIRHKHVVAALGLSNDHTRHGFELSAIRAGLRPIPGGGHRR